uniref:Uncharacterized protein n=1 Tax=Arion vulgaris TaxID=1028688 RepID=A0A0B6YXX7_9EUPU
MVRSIKHITIRQYTSKINAAPIHWVQSKWPATQKVNIRDNRGDEQEGLVLEMSSYPDAVRINIIRDKKEVRLASSNSTGYRVRHRTYLVDPPTYIKLTTFLL